MATITKSLYDTDFVEWTAHSAELVRQGRFDELDLEHVAEEIEDLGKRDFREARAELRRMLMVLIDQKIQPERDGARWRGSVLDARFEIRDHIEDSPSSCGKLAAYLPEAYLRAVKDALLIADMAGRQADLGIPAECPFTLDQLLDADLDSLRF